MTCYVGTVGVHVCAMIDRAGISAVYFDFVHHICKAGIVHAWVWVWVCVCYDRAEISAVYLTLCITFAKLV